DQPREPQRVRLRAHRAASAPVPGGAEYDRCRAGTDALTGGEEPHGNRLVGDLHPDVARAHDRRPGRDLGRGAQGAARGQARRRGRGLRTGLAGTSPHAISRRAPGQRASTAPSSRIVTVTPVRTTAARSSDAKPSYTGAASGSIHRGTTESSHGLARFSAVSTTANHP